MNTHVHFPPQGPWPVAKWRQQAIRFGRYLGLLPDPAPVTPPTRRQQLLAAQDQRRAEQRRAAALARHR